MGYVYVHDQTWVMYTAQDNRIPPYRTCIFVTAKMNNSFKSNWTYNDLLLLQFLLLLVTVDKLMNIQRTTHVYIYC